MAPAARKRTASSAEATVTATMASSIPVIVVTSAGIGWEGCRNCWKGSPTAKPIRSTRYFREEIEDMRLHSKKLGEKAINAMLFSHRKKIGTPSPEFE